MLEDPIQFSTIKKVDEVEVKYTNLMEICQGGPEIGDLYINGKIIEGYRFGGPCIVSNGFVFAPVYVRKFFGFGFKLSKVNTNNLSISVFGKVKDLIFIDKVENGEVYFFEDFYKTQINKMPY